MSLYRRFKDRFGTAGVIIAVIALVAALGGTALAASGKLTSKQKKEVEKIAKKYAGKPGAPGAGGSNGTNGKDGAPGQNGAPGAPGADGKSVTVANTAPGCAEGGATVKVEGATTGTEVCNGEEGSPWTAGGTLPSGKTETGPWIITPDQPIGEEEAGDTIAISLPFNIPLAEPLTFEHVHYVKAGEASPPAACPGTAAEPAAENGNLCVYEQKATVELTPTIGNPGKGNFFPAAGASRAGAILLATLYKGFAFGTWAVTAP